MVPPVRLRHCPKWPKTFFAHQIITKRASSSLVKKLKPQVEYYPLAGDRTELSILIERRTRFSTAIAAVTTNLFEVGKYTDVV